MDFIMPKLLLLVLTSIILLLQGCSKVSELEQLAKNGDVDASYKLGLYYGGIGDVDGRVLKDRRDLDYKRSKELLEFSALNGLATAQYFLGTLYENFSYIDDENYLGKQCVATTTLSEHKDPYEQCMWHPSEPLMAKAIDKAKGWYHKAANGGDGNAQFKMAKYSETCVDMIKWFKKASIENNHYPSYFNLGIIYSDLRSGEFYEPKRAMSIFARIAKNLDNPTTMAEMTLRERALDVYSIAKRRTEGKVVNFTKERAKLYFANNAKDSCKFVHEI